MPRGRTDSALGLAGTTPSPTPVSAGLGKAPPCPPRGAAVSRTPRSFTELHPVHSPLGFWDIFATQHGDQPASRCPRHHTRHRTRAGPLLPPRPLACLSLWCGLLWGLPLSLSLLSPLSQITPPPGWSPSWASLPPSRLSPDTHTESAQGSPLPGRPPHSRLPAASDRPSTGGRTPSPLKKALVSPAASGNETQFLSSCTARAAQSFRTPLRGPRRLPPHALASPPGPPALAGHRAPRR